MLKLFLISHGFNLNAPRICFKYTGIRFFNSKIFSVHRKIEISKIHTKNSSKTVRWIGIDGFDKKLMYGSWMFLGFSFWIILGTTSFVSFALWLADKFQIQECVAKKLGRFLEKNIKVGIEFHGDIVPNWKIRRIVFNSISINNINRPDWEGYSKFDLFIDKLEISISSFNENL